jgi:hypothetical protein
MVAAVTHPVTAVVPTVFEPVPAVITPFLQSFVTSSEKPGSVTS